jgi:hypothetical protein
MVDNLEHSVFKFSIKMMLMQILVVVKDIKNHIVL